MSLKFSSGIFKSNYTLSPLLHHIRILRTESGCGKCENGFYLREPQGGCEAQNGGIFTVAEASRMLWLASVSCKFTANYDGGHNAGILSAVKCTEQRHKKQELNCVLTECSWQKDHSVYPHDDKLKLKTSTACLMGLHASTMSHDSGAWLSRLAFTWKSKCARGINLGARFTTLSPMWMQWRKRRTFVREPTGLI